MSTRRITSGRVGRAILGSIVAENNSLQSVVANANIELEPNGTGLVVSTADIQINAAKGLRLADSDSSNYVLIKSPATLSANYTLTLPPNDGDSGQSLITDGNGVLTWSSASVAVTDQSADTTIYYPTITTTTSGTLSAISTSSSKLTFQPNTGIFGSTALRATGGTASTTTTTGALVVTGGVGVSGQLTAATIVETSSIALKENINPINNALDLVLRLVGVTYDRTDNNEHEAGLIAEDVDKILPDLVSKDELGNPVGIKYTKLTAYLIEAVKSLKFEIDGLKGNK
jgi:hypothetical protein